jgi:hypothetical protein
MSNTIYNNENIDIYCLHYLLKNNELLYDNDFKEFFNNLRYEYYILPSNHICINILDSIHYKILTGDVNYNLYNKYVTITNQIEHNVNNYKKLISNFDINKMETIKVYKKNINNNIKTVIKDGCHRLSILLFNKYSNINNYLIYL